MIDSVYVSEDGVHAGACVCLCVRACVCVGVCVCVCVLFCFEGSAGLELHVEIEPRRFRFLFWRKSYAGAKFLIQAKCRADLVFEEVLGGSAISKSN